MPYPYLVIAMTAAAAVITENQRSVRTLKKVPTSPSRTATIASTPHATHEAISPRLSPPRHAPRAAKNNHMINRRGPHGNWLGHASLKRARQGQSNELVGPAEDEPLAIGGRQ